MPRLRPNIAPPPDYYADNLLSVVAHVQAHSDDLLGPAAAQIAALTGLGVPARRLLARLLMRTTVVVRVDSLTYDEVPDVDAALEELAAAGLVALNPEVAADDLLNRLKVAELKALFPAADAKKRRKNELLAAATSLYTDEAIRTRCARDIAWLKVDPNNALQRVRLTYFGDLYRDLTEFVMRDLGITDYEPYPLGEAARAFEHPLELNHYLELATLQQLPVARRSSALAWVLEHPVVRNPTPDNRTLLRRRDKLLNGWGRDFERSKLHDDAHACYSRATAHPARERRVRLLYKDKKQDAGEALLQQIKGAPWSMEEALFADRFEQRLAGRSASATFPWVETTWTTPHAQLPQVELLTAAVLTQNGGRAWHTENALLRSLLGLAFWDIIFAPEPGMFTHPFQSGPRDLYWPDFRARREAAICVRLQECSTEEGLWARIGQCIAEKFGRSSRLVNWDLVSLNEGEILRAARACFKASQLRDLFDYMLSDLGQVRSGMPDLFVAYGDRSFELVEVKGPSDQLQPNQRVWLSALVERGIPCRVIKHKYHKPQASSG